MKKLIAAALLLCFLLTSCGSHTEPVPQPIKPDDFPKPAPSDGQDPEPEPDAPQTPEPGDDQGDPPVPDASPVPISAEQLLAAMTLEEKVGQLFLIRPESLDPSLTPEQVHETYLYGVTALTDPMIETLKRYPAGGIVIFGKNLEDPAQLETFRTALEAASDIPLVFSVDEEGGKIARIANSGLFDVQKVPPMEDIGATGDTSKAREAGAVIGGYLSGLGFQLDFAPDADINTNPENRVIGNRAFGSDPRIVSDMVSAFLDGLHAAGVSGCIKHFPGHGDPSGDTHEGLVVLDKSWEELQAEELIPFIENFGKTDMVMVAHLTVPNVTDDGLPASLSRDLITGKLRGELGYDGLIVTDALAMGAIAAQYSSAEAALLTFTAGSDILLMPHDYREAFEAIADAVRSGTVSEERLNESVLRILRWKERLGLPLTLSADRAG